MSVNNTPPVGGHAVNVSKVDDGMVKITKAFTNNFKNEYAATEIEDIVSDDDLTGSELDPDDSQADFDEFVRTFQDKMKETSAQTKEVREKRVSDFFQELKELKAKNEIKVGDETNKMANLPATIELEKKVDQELSQLPDVIADKLRAKLMAEKNALMSRFEQDEARFQRRLALIDQTDFTGNDQASFASETVQLPKQVKKHVDEMFELKGRLELAKKIQNGKEHDSI